MTTKANEVLPQISILHFGSTAPGLKVRVTRSSETKIAFAVYGQSVWYSQPGIETAQEFMDRAVEQALALSPRGFLALHLPFAAPDDAAPSIFRSAKSSFFGPAR